MASPGFTRRAGHPPKITPQMTKTNTETRAQTLKMHKKTKIEKLKHTNIQRTSQQQIQIQIHKQTKNDRKYKLWEVVFFLGAGQFLQIRLGRNKKTRRSSGVPKGAECSLLTLSWRAREMYSNERDAELCLCSVTTGTWVATASLASGNVREHAAAREGGGRPRENAVPRHRQVTCPQLVNVRSQTCAERVSFSAVFSP